MIEVNCLATGSTGNCYILKIDGSTVILDAGCKWNKLIANQNLNDVLFAYISHVHKDHSLNEENLRIRGIEILNGTTSGEILKNEFKTKFDSKIRAYRIPIRHGDTENAALIIQTKNECVLYATDFNLCEYDLSSFKFTHILVECNFLDERVVGCSDIKTLRQINTHMSLGGLKIFLDCLDLSQCKEIDLIHLSQQYGNDILMGSAIYTRYQIKTGVCKQHGGIEYYGG